MPGPQVSLSAPEAAGWHPLYLRTGEASPPFLPVFEPLRPSLLAFRRAAPHRPPTACRTRYVQLLGALATARDRVGNDSPGPRHGFPGDKVIQKALMDGLADIAGRCLCAAHPSSRLEETYLSPPPVALIPCDGPSGGNSAVAALVAAVEAAAAEKGSRAALSREQLSAALTSALLTSHEAGGQAPAREAEGGGSRRPSPAPDQPPLRAEAAEVLLAAVMREAGHQGAVPLQGAARALQHADSTGRYPCVHGRGQLREIWPRRRGRGMGSDMPDVRWLWGEVGALEWPIFEG